MKVTDYIDGKVTYDNEGQYFWINTKNDGFKMLGQLRGWGSIHTMKQFRISNGLRSGTIDMAAAEKFQDEIGEFIAQAINEKILILKPE